jgi:hypothetical protein
MADFEFTITETDSMVDVEPSFTLRIRHDVPYDYITVCGEIYNLFSYSERYEISPVINNAISK